MKAIWLDGNPICEKNDNFYKVITQNYKNIELLNGEFTENSDEWVFKFVTYDFDIKKIE